MWGEGILINYHILSYSLYVTKTLYIVSLPKNCVPIACMREKSPPDIGKNFNLKLKVFESYIVYTASPQGERYGGRIPMDPTVEPVGSTRTRSGSGPKKIKLTGSGSGSGLKNVDPTCSILQEKPSDPAGKHRKSLERGTVFRAEICRFFSDEFHSIPENFRSEHCFHVPAISAVFPSEPSRTLRLGPILIFNYQAFLGYLRCMEFSD